MSEKIQLETREKPLEFSTQEEEQSLLKSTMTTSGGWERKCWGRTRTLFQGKQSDLHRLILDVPRAFCSIHYHRHRDNRFTVLLGSVYVVVREGGREVVYSVEENETLFVPAGMIHQFQNTDFMCILLEAYSTYGTDVLDNDDIVRIHEGGVGGQPLAPGSRFLVKS